MNVEAENLTCREVLEHTRGLLEGGLEPAQSGLLRTHLERCEGCRKEVEARRKVMDLLGNAFNGHGISGGFETQATRRLNTMRETGSAAKVLVPSTGPLMSVPVREEVLAVQAGSEGFFQSLTQRFGSAPWWMISVALHVLLIALLGLITMAIGTEQHNEIIVVASLERAPKLEALPEEKKQTDALRDILESKHDTPATDPNSDVRSDIVVPPDILAKAELGDHFETVNPDRPDTQSAFGNPEARMFHSTSGNDEPEGGGGSGGLSLSDDLIGVGGANSPGTGGGWGGGNGTGTGIGNGAGHGSFGQRNGGGRRLMVMRHGGGAATESAVDKGLDWLARHQEADGHWDAAKYGANPNTHKSDIGCTGLALLAFLGAGHSEKVGKYKDNVKRAVYWFIKNQAPNGQYRCDTDPHSSRMYGHGIATMAMSEASGMSRDPETRKSAQKGVEYVSEAQNRSDKEGYQREGWDYKRQGGTNDTSVTSWQILALKSAKIAGLSVEHFCFEGGMNWLNAAQGPDEYKPYIWYRGQLDATQKQQAANPKMDHNNTSEHALLAAAGVMRMFLGEARTSPRVLFTGDYLLQKIPKPLGQWKSYDSYYIYYGTLCMFQIGGDHWKKWNEGLKNLLLPSQVKGGDDDGSWDPKHDTFNVYGGRVYTTAMGCLSLEVYYRYLPLYR